MTNDELLAVVLERLQPLPVSVRSMFGPSAGSGQAPPKGMLPFRTDDESRADYKSREMPALQPKYGPRGPKTVDRHFQVPPDVLADASLLREWALRAVEARR